MSRVVQKVGGFFSFVFEVFYVATLPIVLTGLYSYLVVYLTVLAAAYGWGVFSWVVPVGMLTPVVIVWFMVLERRYREYVAMLLRPQPVKWDIDAAIKGWAELMRGRKQQRKKR